MKELLGLVALLVFLPSFSCNNSYIENTIEYSFNLYRALFEADENTVFSPLSFHVILSILYDCALGDTQADLERIIFKDDQSSVYAEQPKILNHLLKSSSINLANKLYVKQEESVLPSYISVIEKYHSNIEQVDFAKAFEVANNINEWVKSKTNGLIKDLVQPDSITNDTALFLVSSLYFKAKWAEPFSKEQVHSDTFHKFDGTKQEIQFMSNVGPYKSVKSDDFKAEVLEIPYETNSNFVFWIILPNEDSSINLLKESLNLDFVRKITLGLKEDTYDINLPIFEIEATVDGKNVFSKLGLSSLFTNYELHFLERFTNLKVDEMQQKTKIMVNTEGTEASSSTYVKMAFHMIYPKFIANRPFVYAILTADTHIPIFMGHYSKP